MGIRAALSSDFVQCLQHLIIIDVAIVEAFIQFKVKATEKILIPARV